MMTLFIDIDGTLIKHSGTASATAESDLLKERVLPGVYELIDYVYDKGGKIILTTGRPESCRKITEKLLEDARISYDYMLMGLSNSFRFLINDKKTNNTKNSAFAVNVDRDAGVYSVLETLKEIYG